MPALIDPTLQEEFLREGFVTTRLLETEAARSLRAEIAAINAGDWAINHQPTGNYLSMYDDRRDLKARIDALVQHVIYPRLAHHFCDYTPAVNTVFTKPAGARDTQLHQHAPVSEHPFETNIAVWCALSDCGPDTGAAFVVPRSHHLYRFLRVYDQRDFFDSYRDRLVKRHARRLRFKAGEALIMDNSLLHGASENRGVEARMAVATLLMNPGSTFLIYRSKGDHVVAMDASGEPLADVQMMMVAPTRWVGPVRKRFPVWGAEAGLRQTEALLARCGPRATETDDPLDRVAHLAPRPPRPPFDWRASARRLPGAVPTVHLARRTLSKLRGLSR